jgi:squalene-hopene/tetraprenyl-beta-curcumene cyclase
MGPRVRTVGLLYQGEQPMKSALCVTTVLTAALLASAAAARAGDKEPAPTAEEVRAVLDKAAAYLKSHQEANGAFSPKRAGPGITALVAAALLRAGRTESDPVVAKALQYLEKQVKKDGGIYDRFLANYTTSVAIMAFREANAGGKYDALIKNGARFIRGLQHGQPDTDPKNVEYGGFGYDRPGKGRPDMSNTQFSVEALLAAGVPKDDPAIQRALRFIGRCQNLSGEFNDQEFAKKATKEDKGGFVYVPDPDDKRHKTAAGGLRSLGGMTYGGLKSFLYAGVSKDDPRVRAAVDWIRRHYTLKENPGMGQAGLYYYYHVFAKAMEALGEDPFTDAKGTKHSWRRELFEALRSRQQPDGSWRNPGDQTFGEGDPNLATAFAVLTLSYCRPTKR